MASQPITDEYTDWMQAASDAEEGRANGLPLLGGLIALLVLAAFLL